jgi:hypothetical protein
MIPHHGYSTVSRKITRTKLAPLGTLFSPEFRETTRRLRRKEVELDAVVDKGSKRKTANDRTESSAAHSEPGPANREELVKLIEAIVDRKLQKLLDELVALVPGPGRAVKGEDKTVKFTISMPGSLHEQLQTMGGTVSAHITAAVRLYLRVKRKHETDS